MRKPTAKQRRFLESLARSLGYPNESRMVHDFFPGEPLSMRIASKSIDRALEKLSRCAITHKERKWARERLASASTPR